PRCLDPAVAVQPGGGHHAVVRPDGAALIRVRVVRGMVFGKSSHAPTTEHVGPHEPLTGEPAAARIEDAHPKAVPGIRDDGADRLLVAVERERELVAILQPEALMEAAPQLHRLYDQAARAVAIAPRPRPPRDGPTGGCPRALHRPGPGPPL